jgi:predicted flap endonuclease-1-like 5' DNA nuclease
MLSSLGCCFWWFLAGALLGWLLNRWLCKCCCKTKPSSTTHSPAAPAKMADVPAAPAATIAPKAAPVVKAAAPKAAPKAAAKAKPKAKPKAAASSAAVIDLAAAKKAGFAIKNANDLTIVEGIGPKINDLFNNAGIKTFAQLSAATVPQMRKILDDGGSRFRIANPGTWAQQAALAANNKWAELKALQDKLSAGLKK